MPTPVSETVQRRIVIPLAKVGVYREVVAAEQAVLNGVAVTVRSGAGSKDGDGAGIEGGRTHHTGADRVAIMIYHYALLIHILCATIWTGGHLVLALAILPKTLRTREVDELHAFESKYERVGIPALILLVVTGVYLAHIRVPDFSRWLSFDDPFTKLIGYKLLLLATTVLLAIDARLRLIPRLSKDNLNQLAWHIIPVTIVAVAFVLVGVGFRFGKVF